jgi:hypothetical protein
MASYIAFLKLCMLLCYEWLPLNNIEIWMMTDDTYMLNGNCSSVVMSTSYFLIKCG